MTRGFSLVEVIIATALLILSLAVFIVSFVQSTRSSVIADNSMDALHRARGTMEALCASSYTSTGLSVGTHTIANGFYIVSNNAIANVKDITLTLNWINPGSSITSSVTLAGSISSELHQ